MARGRWKPSKNLIAREAYAVFIDAERLSRVYDKEYLMHYLADPAIYTDFLKLCLEFDDSKELREFRKGLLTVVKAIGATKAADRTQISRMTLYRMLAKGGNPRLSSLVGLIKSLGINLWIVDQDFMKRRSLSPRPKDQPLAAPIPKRTKF